MKIETTKNGDVLATFENDVDFHGIIKLLKTKISKNVKRLEETAFRHCEAVADEIVEDAAFLGKIVDVYKKRSLQHAKICSQIFQ